MSNVLDLYCLNNLFNLGLPFATTDAQDFDQTPRRTLGSVHSLFVLSLHKPGFPR